MVGDLATGVAERGELRARELVDQVGSDALDVVGGDLDEGLPPVVGQCGERTSPVVVARLALDETRTLHAVDLVRQPAARRQGGVRQVTHPHPPLVAGLGEADEDLVVRNRDAVLGLKSIYLNGYTELALTKLDVLTGIDPIKICVGYELDGETLGYPPESTADLARCKPIYEEMAGWTEDITGVEDYDDLPQNARDYVEKLEDLLGVEISAVSVGPGREQTVFRDMEED